MKFLRNLRMLYIMLCASMAGFAQTNIGPQLVSASGGSSTIASVNYDWSVAEPFTDFGGPSCDSLFHGFQHAALDTLRFNKGTIGISGPTTFCPNSNVILSAPGGASWFWSNGATTQTVSINQSGTYHVKTTNSCGDTLGSNSVLVTVVTPAVPSICLVTADSLSVNNILYWDKTPYTNVDSFIVYREVSTGIYSRIGAVSVDSLSMFVDDNRAVGPANGDPNIAYYHYKLQLRDTCGSYSALSPYHTTVYFIDNHNGNFQWNLYDVQNQTTPVLNFGLYRDSANINDWHNIGFASGTTTILNDPTYLTYQAIANWRVEATGFSCIPTAKVGANGVSSTVVKSKSNITNNKTTGISSSNPLVTVFPNPATHLIHFNLQSNLGQGQVEFFNMVGEKVLSQKIEESRFSINVEGMSAGVYLIKVSARNYIFEQKLIKE